MKPIYIPKGAAKEYGDYALNIYTGCPHECFYCFAPRVLFKKKQEFHNLVEPRKNIFDETIKQIEKESITGKLINLCFSCDPYPKGFDSSTTRKIIKLLKRSGNNVQVLTKNGLDAMRDFDLLDGNDWFGITYAGYNGNVSDNNFIPSEEPNAGTPHDRLYALKQAHKLGIKTWVSAEPVINEADILSFIECADYVDMWKVGKLNYYQSEVNWYKFGHTVENLLKSKNRIYGINFYIKQSLRKEMEK